MNLPGKTALINGQVYREKEFFPCNVYINGGTIEKFSPWEKREPGYTVIDCEGKRIIPGFIDIHTHGRNGNNVMDANKDLDVLQRMAAELLPTGVTSFMPALLTSSFDDYTAVTKSIARYIDIQKDNVAQALGIYSEGVFFCKERAGAHNPDNLKNPLLSEVKQVWEAGQDKLKILALAPELPGSEESIPFLRGKDVIVSMGHSEASYVEALAAYKLGARGATHVMNAMKQIHHMEPSIAGACMYLDDITTEIIADGIHLKPEIVNILFRVKPLHRIVLVTDNTWIAGMPKGDYFLGPVAVSNMGDRLELKGSKTYLLAGSCLTMDLALRNAVKFTGRPLEDILQCMTINPAKYIKVDNFTGQLKEGYKADINILNENLFVEKTFVNGYMYDHYEAAQ